MRFRSGLLLLLLLVLVFGVASRSHASAILFNNRAQFDSFLEGDYQLFTEFPITDFSLISSFVAIGDYGALRFAGTPSTRFCSEVPYRPTLGLSLVAF